MKTVSALIVTYNRKNLLAECLRAVNSQSTSCKDIVVLDNNSTDGTEQMIKSMENKISNLHYLKMSENLGGAGGFNYGMKYCLTHLSFDYLWIMDDDTIPQTDCAERAMNHVDDLEASQVFPSFIASAIFGEAGEPMNVPTISTEKSKNGYRDWYRYLAKKVVKIESATFVSLFFRRESMLKAGLPIKEYFIWGDDTEYTVRMTHDIGPAFMAGDSLAIHKRKTQRHYQFGTKLIPKELPCIHICLKIILRRKDYIIPNVIH